MTGEPSRSRPASACRSAIVAGLACSVLALSGCTQMMVWIGEVLDPTTTRGYHLIEDGRCAEAIPVLEAALKEDKFKGFDYLRMTGIAVCQYSVGEFAAAERTARSVIEHYSHMPVLVARTVIAYSRYERGDLDGAVKAAQELAIAVPRSDSENQTIAAAILTWLTIIRDGHELDEAIEFGDCDTAAVAARRMLALKPKGGLDAIPAGNRVLRLRRGGVAELAGLIPGDEVQSIAATKVTTALEWNDAENALIDRYGETIPVEIIRRKVPGEDATDAAVERRLTIQVRLVYPELERAQAFMDDYQRDRSKFCATPADGTGDRIPPQILVLEPKVRDLAIRPVAAKGASVQFVVLASDNLGVRSVEVDGTAGVATDPSAIEGTFLPGHVRKFTVGVPVGTKERKIAIRATDTAGNRTETTVALTPSKTDTGTPGGPLFGSSVALVIGIDDYREAPPLEFAVQDAKAVAERLRSAGFERVIELHDREATRGQILRVFADELPGVLEAQDRFVFFFAGHGQTDTIGASGTQEGYLIPYDGRISDFRGTGLSMTKIHEVVGRFRSKQMLLVFDSCYSGLGLKRAMPTREPGGLIRKLAGQRAVQIITAGGKDEQAAEAGGHGLFTQQLLVALSGAADTDRDGYLLGSEIGSFVRRQVSDASHNQQTPLWGWVAGDGDFVLEVGH